MGVCVDDDLALVRLIGPWSWVGLSNQCAQVKPAITTHTGRDLMHGNMEH